jgi:Ni/Fe-hydrogenase subunit HybB-like protein
MSSHNAIAFAFDLAIGIGIALVLFALLRNSLRELLDNVIKLPEGTTLYLRVLVLVFLLQVLAKVITGIHLKPDAHFMEYVWEIAGHLSSVFGDISYILLVYLGMITVLVVVLRAKNGK